MLSALQPYMDFISVRVQCRYVAVATGGFLNIVASSALIAYYWWNHSLCMSFNHARHLHNWFHASLQQAQDILCKFVNIVLSGIQSNLM